MVQASCRKDVEWVRIPLCDHKDVGTHLKLCEGGSVDPSMVSMFNGALGCDAGNVVLTMALTETRLLE